MKTALIYGTTGLIGSDLLRLLLRSSEYKLVKALTRRPVGIDHKKLEEITYDFENPEPSILLADHVFCCLGTTMKKAGSRKAFYRIDHDYVVETAQFTLQNGAKSFSLVSAIGSDPSSRIFYNRVKGEVEQEINKLAFEGVHIYQPSLLMGKRKEFRLIEAISQKIMKIINPVVPSKYRGVKAKKIAEVMLANAIQFPQKSLVVSNQDIIRFNNREYE